MLRADNANCSSALILASNWGLNHLFNVSAKASFPFAIAHCSLPVAGFAPQKSIPSIFLGKNNAAKSPSPFFSFSTKSAVSLHTSTRSETPKDLAKRSQSRYCKPMPWP